MSYNFIMSLQNFIQEISAPVMLAIAGAALRFMQKISSDIRDLTMTTKELHIRLLSVDDKLDDHEGRLRVMERKK
jgi:hypothetical protein